MSGETELARDPWEPREHRSHYVRQGTWRVPLECGRLTWSLSCRVGAEEVVGVKAHAGDRIVVESERATQPPRRGVVEEVIAEDPPRLRVLWDDGHTTVVAPEAGAVSIEEAATKTS